MIPDHQVLIPEGYEPASSTDRRCLPKGTLRWSEGQQVWKESLQVGEPGDANFWYVVPLRDSVEEKIEIAAKDTSRKLWRKLEL